jgi:DNA transposition AAA+ family ATPase
VAPERFVQTSIARRLMARLRATHERRRISIFSGPPGIGKTTAIDAFRSLHPETVVVVKVARRPAKEVLVLQHALEGFRQMAGTTKRFVPSSIWELRTYFFREICAWAGVDLDEALASPSGDEDRRLTFVFDEAQNLSRAAIEVLRYWNDGDRCYAPFPLGLVFVGNNEFALRSDGREESAISAAVADRALHVQALEYDDVTDSDLEMFLQARGLADASAVGTVLRYFRTTRVPRSLRRLEDLLDDVMDLADGRPVTGPVVQEALFAV